MKRSFILFLLVLTLIVSSLAFASCTGGANTGSDSLGGNSFSESNFDGESLEESLKNSPKDSVSQSEPTESVKESESESENESVIESATENDSESEEIESTDAKWFKFTLLENGSAYSVSKCDDYDELTYPTTVLHYAVCISRQRLRINFYLSTFLARLLGQYFQANLFS